MFGILDAQYAKYTSTVLSRLIATLCECIHAAFSAAEATTQPYSPTTLSSPFMHLLNVPSPWGLPGWWMM